MQAFTLKHPKTLAIIPTIESVKKLTENDQNPFDPNPIMKVLVSFEEHFEGRPDPPVIPNFLSIHWKLVEKQVSSGFIINPKIQDEINKHKSSLAPISKLEQMMEEMFVNAY